jgi:hypothetical protein
MIEDPIPVHGLRDGGDHRHWDVKKECRARQDQRIDDARAQDFDDWPLAAQRISELAVAQPSEPTQISVQWRIIEMKLLAERVQRFLPGKLAKHACGNIAWKELYRRENDNRHEQERQCRGATAQHYET